MMQVRAEIRTPHHIDFGQMYPAWGLAGESNHDSAEARGAFHTRPATPEEKALALGVICDAGIDPKALSLATALVVPCYQGPKYPKISAVLLRYTKSGHVAMGKEHMSFLVDISDAKLIGLTNMTKQASTDLVHPSVALNKAFGFLKHCCSDLVTIETMPNIDFPDSLVLGQGVNVSTENAGIFSAGMNLGSVSLHWIDKHDEKIEDDAGNEAIIDGMKVKMQFNDGSERYAWAIVDGYQNIEVFERNIFWNFSAFKRETQMWLHDGWLQAHGQTPKFASACDHEIGCQSAFFSATDSSERSQVSVSSNLTG